MIDGSLPKYQTENTVKFTTDLNNEGETIVGLVETHVFISSATTDIRSKCRVPWGAWLWDVDQEQLYLGDGKELGGLARQYRGGNITICSGKNTFMPPALPLYVIMKKVLHLGEIVYCIDDDILRIGNGTIRGGIAVQKAL